MSDARTDELLEAWLGGQTGPDQEAELRRLLETDAQVRRALRERALLEVHLYRACAAAAAETGAPAERPSRLRLRAGHAPAAALAAWLHRRPWAVAAALLLAAGLLAIALLLAPPRPAEHNVLSGAVLVDGRPHDRIPDGAMVAVTAAGPAVVQLADGSQATLDPATRLAFRQQTSNGLRQVVDLQAGGGEFSVVHADGRFRVDTPVGSVTALGTVFSVRLQPVGAAEASRSAATRPDPGLVRHLAVAVRQGEVRVEVGGKSYDLSAGQTRVFRPGRESHLETGRRLHGRLEALNRVDRSLILRLGDSGSERFALHPEVTASFDGQPAGLDELVPGLTIQVLLAAEEALVVRLEAQAPQEVATFLRADTARHALAIRRDREGRAAEALLPLSREVRVVINGHPRLLTDLQPGSRVTLFFSADRKQVVRVQSGRSRDGEHADGHDADPDRE